MEWLSIYNDGLPDNDKRVLTYSESYGGNPELSFRIMDGNFVRLCTDVTHYVYLTEPK